jgi:hypothetical protein
VRYVVVQTLDGNDNVLSEEHFAAATAGAALDKHAPDPRPGATFKVLVGTDVQVAPGPEGS